MRVDHSEIRRRTHDRVLADLTPGSSPDARMVANALSTVAPLLDSETFDAFVREVLAEIHGLGPLEALMADPEVTDVMVVGGRGIWIERRGELVETNTTIGPDEVGRLVERIVAPLGLRVDRASPMVDARLPDGSRVNAVVPPLAVDGACLTIRRFGRRTIPLEEMASAAVAELLERAVRVRSNILVSGGTGSGKTTLLNALSSKLPPKERIVTVEDAAELRLPLRHVVRLESRPANSEGAGLVSLRELVRNALRMRPDRIVVGEVRGAEALDMLQAMNTGHEGSMSTCHANTPTDALRRIETMVLMGEVALPLDAVRRQISSAIDLVVQIERTHGGHRKVVEVAEVFDNEGVPEARTVADSTGVVARPRRFARRAVADQS